MKVRKVFALSILTASMALAAGCSSDDDDEEMPDTTDPVTDPVTDPDPVEPVADTTTNMGTSILDIARGTDGDDEDMEIDEGTANADLTSLVAAVASVPNAQSILNLLDDENAVLTVFAPNNEAFAALGDAAPAGEALEGVLNYHVISGTNLDATAISSTLTAGAEGVELETANGDTLTASLSEDGTMVTLTDGQGNEVPVLASDETPANGTVHVIGSVLLPPTAAEPTEPTDGEMPVDGPVTGAEGSALGSITGDAELSSFAALVSGDADGWSRSLDDIDENDGNNPQFVTFAPTNTVYAAIDPAPTNPRNFTVTSIATPGALTADADYVGFTQGADAGITFSVTGTAEGDSLMVNGEPAEYLTTGGEGGTVIKYGPEVAAGSGS